MASDLIYIQEIFEGLNQRVDTSLLNKGEFPLLVNGRVRTGVVKPIKTPTKIASLPAGNYQGVYAAANYLIVFIDGKAYVKDYNFPLSEFKQIADLQLSATVPTIYIALVPESYVNYLRASSDGTPSGEVTLSGSSTNFSPRVLVCQDGINQPWLLFPSGVARESFDYVKWSVSNREYVPVGKQMLYFDGKLYIVSPDGLKIYHSVTGRPLDFVIVVDTNGDKLPTGGDAEAWAWRINYEPITAIREISSTNREIFVSTERSSYLVRPNYDVQYFGEPTFSNQFLFTTGAKNQFSVVDILGDTSLVDFGGIKSFNSILQTQSEGKNSAFSDIISKLFAGIEQSVTAAISFDNYALFSVSTVYGSVVVVYDTIIKRYVSIDLVPAAIKQFTEVVTSSSRKLFFITSDNELYEAYSGELDNCYVYIGDFSSRDPKIEQRPAQAKLVFLNVEESGTVYVTPYADGKSFTALKKELKASETPRTVPYDLPFGPATEDRVRTVTIDFNGVNQCWKFGLFINWQFDAELSFVQFTCDDAPVGTSYEQAGLEYKHNVSNRPVFDSVSPSDCSPNAVIHITGKGFLEIKKLYLNNTEWDFILLDDARLTIIGPSVVGVYNIKALTDTGTEFCSTQINVN